MTSDVFMRWMIAKDQQAVLAIEQASFDEPWTQEDLCNAMKSRNVIGMVVERQEQVLGFMVYELMKDDIRILDFAVHPRYRRSGVGATMIDRLKGKLSLHRRTRVVEVVRERNLPMQRLLAKHGFICEAIERNVFGHGEDGYRFVYRLEWGCE